MAVINGQVMGVWVRTLSAKTVRIEIDAFFNLTDTESEAGLTLANQLGDLHERLPKVVIVRFAAQ